MPDSHGATRFLSARHLGGTGGLLLLPLGLLGCSKPETGSVSGKVTVKGAKPALGTSIKFIGPDGKEVSGGVNDDGSYAVYGVPVGEAKIVVMGATFAATPPVGAAADLSGTKGVEKGAVIAKKYATPGALPGFSVKKGENTHDIDLEPGPGVTQTKPGALGGLPGMGLPGGGPVLPGPSPVLPK